MKIGVVSNNDLCLPLLYFLHGNKVDVQLYFGQSLVNDQSRDTVDAFCKNSGINFQNGGQSKDSIYPWMNSFSPDAVFVLGHIHKIKRNSINVPSSIYNIHFGKLPEYRGSSPVFWQLKNMETEIGCSIHALTDEMDAGPVYWQKEIKNEKHFTHNYVQYIFSNLVVDGVKEILLNSNSSQPKEQDATKVHWYKRPSLKDVLVKWDTMKAGEICALANACNSWNVGAITLFNGIEVKIIDADYSKSNKPSNLIPGTVNENSEALCVSCVDDEELNIHYMTLNGIPVAGRHAKKFGITEGQKFTYPSD
ncbi:MAG TPA: formyltransferase family protein [Chitinophagaceae bacterium]|nr:formyltransferase family protein [Chitinophagaceae bacterium]